MRPGALASGRWSGRHSGRHSERRGGRRIALQSALAALSRAAAGGVVASIAVSGCVAVGSLETGPIDAGRLQARLADLPPDRAIGSPGHAAARRWLIDTLSSLGLEPEVKPFTWSGAPGADLANVEVRWPGAGHGAGAVPLVLVTAHYDSVPGSPGADDNGSGSCVLLELARRFAARSFASELRLVWFDAEERGLIGSGSWVKDLPDEDRQRIAGVLNLETMGYTDRRAGSQRMPPGTRHLLDPGDRGDFLLVLGNFASAGLAGTVRAAMEPEQGPAFRAVTTAVVPGNGWLIPDSRRSDHAVFWDAGVPALLLTDTANLRSPHYHTAGDALSTLDLPFLAAGARGVERAVLALAGGPPPAGAP